MPKEESTIHVKLENTEAIQSKRALLSSEMYLLKIIKALRRYNALRSNELRTKLKIQKELKSLKSNIKKIQNNYPKTKIPEKLRKDDKEPITKTEKKRATGNIEYELEDIKNKLLSLQNK